MDNEVAIGPINEIEPRIFIDAYCCSWQEELLEDSRDIVCIDCIDRKGQIRMQLHRCYRNALAFARKHVNDEEYKDCVFIILKE